MINAILNGIISFITGIISLFLLPINVLLQQFVPNFSNVISYINNFFDLCLTYIGYVLDLTFLDTEVVSFIILYWVFKLTLPYLVWAVKLVVKWYNSLKV